MQAKKIERIGAQLRAPMRHQARVANYQSP
jgi:hypothetical protein